MHNPRLVGGEGGIWPVRQFSGLGDETLKELFTRALTRELSAHSVKRRGDLPLIRSRRVASVSISPERLAESLSEHDIDQLLLP